MEERQRAKPRARATWLVMQLQCWGCPRKTMEQRKVTTRAKSRVKLSTGSLAFTRGVLTFTMNTTWTHTEHEMKDLSLLDDALNHLFNQKGTDWHNAYFMLIVSHVRAVDNCFQLKNYSFHWRYKQSHMDNITKDSRDALCFIS